MQQRKRIQPVAIVFQELSATAPRAPLARSIEASRLRARQVEHFLAALVEAQIRRACRRELTFSRCPQGIRRLVVTAGANGIVCSIIRE
jgi:hypothetical protein